MLPQQLPRNGHCLQSTEHRISNRSIRIHRIDSPRIEQLFEQWKQQRRRSNQQQQQLIMDPQKNVVVTKKSEGEDQAALAWLKRCLDVDRLSEYIDRNILAFRYLPYAVAIAGVAVLLRSIRLATKFRDCSQIPRSFVRQNVQLRGRLVDVDLAEGTLSVEHQPILLLPSFWSRLQKNNNSNNSSQYLQLRLAFTSPTIAGIYWMRLNVNGAPIKFRLIDHHCGATLEEDQKKKRIILWAAVNVVQQQQHKNSKLSKSSTLNETLIRNGLAEVGGPFPLPNRTLLSKREAKLLHRLELAEAKAVQEGLGLWNDNATTTADSSTGTALITVGQQVIRSWWTAIINCLKWALSWLRTKTTTKEQ